MDTIWTMTNELVRLSERAGKRRVFRVHRLGKFWELALNTTLDTHYHAGVAVRPTSAGVWFDGLYVGLYGPGYLEIAEAGPVTSESLSAALGERVRELQSAA